MNISAAFCSLFLVWTVSTSVSCRHIHHGHPVGMIPMNDLTYRKTDRGDKIVVDRVSKGDENRRTESTGSSEFVEFSTTRSPRNAEPEAKSETVKSGDRSKTVIGPISMWKYEQMLWEAVMRIVMEENDTEDVTRLLRDLGIGPEEAAMLRAKEMERLREEKELLLKEKEQLLKVKEKLLREEKERKMLEQSESRLSKGITRMEVDYKKAKMERDEKKELAREKKLSEEMDEENDYDTWNKKALEDYENAPNRQEPIDAYWIEEYSVGPSLEEAPKTTSTTFTTQNAGNPSFGDMMEANAIFRISPDDFDSNSQEAALRRLKSADRATPTDRRSKIDRFPATAATTTGDLLLRPLLHGLPTVATRQEFANTDVNDPYRYETASIAPGQTEIKLELSTLNSTEFQKNSSKRSSELSSSASRASSEVHGSSIVEASVDDSESSSSSSSTTTEKIVTLPSTTPSTIQNSTESTTRRAYKGLEWVGDDVYRVLPGALDYGNEDFDCSEDEICDNDAISNETIEKTEENYQDEAPDPETVQLHSSANISLENLVNTTNHRNRAAIDRRQLHRQKAMRDAMDRILLLTRKTNTTTGNIPMIFQPERLAMFLPTCELPRNTDADAWADPYLMNMQFSLNLTSSQRIKAAKLRLFKLPQEKLTSNVTSLDESDDEETKIEISVYYYAKSLKKNRSKKKLMDSIVSPLTTTGGPVALDVRGGSRYWRANQRNSGNHGLVVQVKDQDGRQLQPSQYIQPYTCNRNQEISADQDQEQNDNKAYQRVPALFIGACPCNVRGLNN